MRPRDVRPAWLSGLAFALAACVGVPPVTTAPDSISTPSVEWRGIDEGVRGAKDLVGLQRMAQDHPWSRNIRVALVNGYLDAGRNADALAEIVRLTDAGFAFSANGKRALLGLFDGADREALERAFAADPQSLEASEVVAKLPSEALLIETVALDRHSGRLFAGSIVSRALFVKAMGKSEWSRVPLAGLGSVGGLLVDEKRRVLWIASGVYEETPDPGDVFSGLIGLPLGGGPERRISAPAGSTPSDIMLASDGSLYAADPIHGMIYRAGPGESSFSVFVEPGTFRSPQGMVETDEGVLVSDWGYGLALVERASGKVFRVDPEGPLLLDGIDGMWRRGDDIVAIQNGARPAQIVSFRLAGHGTRVIGWRVLERAVAGWTEPASGSLSGNELLYVGNGQWDRFAGGGAVREGKQPQPTEIRRLELAKKLAAAPKNPG